MSRRESMRDYSMLDLFRQEVETQVTNLKQSLSILKQQPSSNSELESATRSLHAIAGSAQIVEIDAAADLASAMTTNLIAADDHSIELTQAQIELLLHAADLLLGISRATKGDLEPYLVEHAQNLSSTQTAISQTIAEDIAQPSSQDTPVTPTATTEAAGDIATPTPPAVWSKPVGGDEQGEQGSQLRAYFPPPPQTGVEQGELKFVPTTYDHTSPPDSPTPPKPLIEDSSMLELFRLEVEAQATILTNGLLALESQPKSPQQLEALMRAAHSVKGAARIVGLDAAVGLAHVMEDCFVAAQNQIISLDADQIDVLLRGVDILQSLSQIGNSDLADTLAQNGSEIESIRGAIAAIQTGAAIPQPPVTPPPSIPEKLNSDNQNHSTPVVQPESVSLAPRSPVAMEASNNVQDGHAASQHVATSDRVVRVSAENLNRMMGLAGESLIEANWLPPFADSLMLLKSRQIQLSNSLEQLQQNNLLNTALSQDSKALLESARSKEQECRDLLSDRLTELEGFIRRTANLSDRLYREVITSHMRPFEDGVQSFPRMVRDIARQLNKQVKLEILGKSTSVDRDILNKLEAPLTHILRNAVDHGLELPQDRIKAGKPETGTIRLEAFHRGGMLAITIADDGKGIEPQMLRQRVIDQNLAAPEEVAKMSDAELMEFLFLPGFSMAKQVTELSGRGVGLDIAYSMAQEVGGSVRATSVPGHGTSFYFQLPLTLSVVRTLLVEISGEAYAFPLARIDKIVNVRGSEIASVQNRQYLTLDEKNIGLIWAHQVLDLPPPLSSSSTLWVVILSDSSNTYGLVVERCLGERELVVRPLDPRLGKVQNISAAALMGDGSLVLIVDVSDLMRSLDNLLKTGLALVGEAARKHDHKQVLVVDDSITVREMERKLLQNRGYSVDVAVDGMEGWNAIRSHPYDLVISDIDMPRMNGIELLKQIKSHPRLKSIPVIVVSYRDREEDRIQGLEAGADYYLTKSSFHDDTLIEAVVDLIGE